MKTRLAILFAALALSCPVARAQTGGNMSSAQLGSPVPLQASSASDDAPASRENSGRLQQCSAPPALAPAPPPPAPPDNWLANPAPSLDVPPPGPVATDGPDHPAAAHCLWGDGCGGSWGHVEAGIEALAIRPRFQTNAALEVTTSVAGASQSNQVNFVYPYTVNPRVWLGYVTDSGLGCRVGWWSFEQAANSVTVGLPTPPAGGKTISIHGFFDDEVFADADSTPTGAAATSDVRLNVLDFEAMQVFHAGSCQIAGSAGIRYAHLAQNYNAFLFDSFGTGDQLTEQVGQNFDGAGPTLSVEVCQPVCFGLGLFASLRGSALFGSSHLSNSLQSKSAEEIVLAADPTDSEVSDQLSFLCCAEAELGVDYTRKVGPVCLFVQTGITVQLWVAGGNATSREEDMTFFGYTVAAGITY